MEKPLPPSTDVDLSAVEVAPPSPFSPRADSSHAESDLPNTRHAYSYLNKQAQRESVRSLPPEGLTDFELLHEFELSGQDHTAEAQVCT